MAERLTSKNTVSVYNNSNSEIYLSKGEEATKYIYKLAQLEDIMEKYHCNDIEELEKKLADSDTWQKACELACETLKQVMGKPLWIGGNIPTPEVKDSDYFYQQAKKENKKVQIHYCTNDETNKILGDIKIKDDFSTTMQNLAKIYVDTLKDLDTAEDKDN